MGLSYLCIVLIDTDRVFKLHLVVGSHPVAIPYYTCIVYTCMYRVMALTTARDIISNTVTVQIIRTLQLSRTAELYRSKSLGHAATFFSSTNYISRILINNPASNKSLRSVLIERSSCNNIIRWVTILRRIYSHRHACFRSVPIIGICITSYVIVVPRNQ